MESKLHIIKLILYEAIHLNMVSEQLKQSRSLPDPYLLQTLQTMDSLLNCCQKMRVKIIRETK